MLTVQRALPRDPLEVRAVRADEVDERVAAELLARRAGELERDGRLGDDRERLDRSDVAPLDERLRLLAGREVDRAQRLHQRRQRLHRRADDELFAVRDAGLDPARAVGLAAVAGQELVVRLASAQRGEREAVADLDALDRLDPHHGRGEPRVETLRLRRVRPEPRRDAASRAPRRCRRPCRDRRAPRRSARGAPPRRRPLLAPRSRSSRAAPSRRRPPRRAPRYVGRSHARARRVRPRVRT